MGRTNKALLLSNERALTRFVCERVYRASRLSGNPPDKPKVPEVEFSKKEVLREEVKIYRQPDHGCPQTC